MMYKFMTLNDKTEIVHSEMYEDGRVKIYIEKPVRGDFHSAVCWLPGYKWENIDGFTSEEIDSYRKLISNLAATIMRFARDGGYEYAACV